MSSKVGKSFFSLVSLTEELCPRRGTQAVHNKNENIDVLIIRSTLKTGCHSFGHMCEAWQSITLFLQHGHHRLYMCELYQSTA